MIGAVAVRLLAGGATPAYVALGHGRSLASPVPGSRFYGAVNLASGRMKRAFVADATDVPAACEGCAWAATGSSTRQATGNSPSWSFASGTAGTSIDRGSAFDSEGPQLRCTNAAGRCRDREARGQPGDAEVGIGDALIVAKIETAAMAFDTSVDGLVALSKSGIGEEVMVKSEAASASIAAAETQPGDFGDDGSMWANDGECDDSRFTAPACRTPCRTRTGATAPPLAGSDAGPRCRGRRLIFCNDVARLGGFPGRWWR